MSGNVAATRRPGQGPRPISDFYPTPSACTRALMARLDPPRDTLIDEPAAGDGAIVRELRALGYPTVASDVYDHRAPAELDIASGVDFFSLRHARAGWLITNPPFSLAEPFLRHALGIGYRVIALFLPLGFLAASSRRDVTTGGCLGKVLILQPRPTLYPAGYARGNSGTVHYAWMIWFRRRSGPIHLDGLDWRPFARAGER